MAASAAWQHQQQQPASFAPMSAAGNPSGMAQQQGWTAMVGFSADDARQHMVPQHMMHVADRLVLQEDGGACKKPRLRWTAQLHLQFVAAVQELGGPFTATPKRILAAMAVPGMTLFHVKSHLQKYRNAVAGGGDMPAASNGGGGGKRRGGQGKKRDAPSTVWRGGSRGSSWAGSDTEDEDGAPPGDPEPRFQRQETLAALHQPGLVTSFSGVSHLSAETGAAAAPARQAPPAPPPGGGAEAMEAPEALLQAWGSEPDLEGLEAELAATLAPAGSLSSEDLLDLPADSLRHLEQGLHADLACFAGASRADAVSRGAAPAQSIFTGQRSEATATRLHPHGGSDSGASGGCAAQASSHACSGGGGAASGPRQADVPPAAAAGARPAEQQRADTPGCGLSAEDQDMLQAALHMQVEMQRQLSQAIEAQRALQLQMETHGKYVQALLRSDEDAPPQAKRAKEGRTRDSSHVGGTNFGTSAAASGFNQRSSFDSAQASGAAGAALARAASAPAAQAPQAQAQPPHPQLRTAVRGACPASPAVQLQSQGSLSHLPSPPRQQPQEQPQLARPPSPTLQSAAASLPLISAASAPMPSVSALPPPSAAVPAWQLQQRFMQQQLELERRIRQRQAQLQWEAEEQRQLLEQQQLLEHAAAAAFAATAGAAAPQPTVAAPSAAWVAPTAAADPRRCSHDGPLSPGGSEHVRCARPVPSMHSVPSLASPRLATQTCGPVASNASCATLTHQHTPASLPIAAASVCTETGGSGISAAPAPAGARWQQPPAGARLAAMLDPGLMDASAWDSLLSRSGVMSRLLA